MIKPAQGLSLHCRTPTAKALWSEKQPDKRLKCDAAKRQDGGERGLGDVDWGGGAGYPGNISEVGQMIQYPKQIGAHIPLLHSALPPLMMRCEMLQ